MRTEAPLLQGDRTLSVHVTDANGADAAGVPLRLLQLDDRGRQARAEPEPRLTDERGMVTFTRLQKKTTWRSEPDAGQPIAAFAVAVVTPGLAVAPLRVERDTVPDTPLELRLRPTAHLTLRVVFEGQPVPGLTSIAVHTDTKRAHDARYNAWEVPLDEQGVARLRHLPPDRRFVVEGSPWHVEIDGPTGVGQDLHTTLELSRHVYALSGRVLNGADAPVADTALSLRYGMQKGGGGSGPLQTDGDGRFFRILSNVQEGAVALEEFLLEPREQTTPQRRCRAQPRELQAGRNDLGDLRLTVAGLIVSGRVRFDCGEPRPVDVVLERHGDARSGWEPLYELQQSVAEDGTFELRGDVAPGNYRLAMSDRFTLPTPPVEFLLGATGLDIAVRCAHGLTIPGLLPEGVAPDSVRLRLDPHPGVEELTQASADSPFGNDRHDGAVTDNRVDRGEASFVWRGLPAGIYALQVSVGTRLLTAIDEVVLPQPPEGDPRLHPLDLRQHLAALQVKLLDPTDPNLRMPQRTIAFLLPQPEQGQWQGVTLWGHGGTLAVPPGAVDLLLVPEGMRAITLHGVQGKAEATLQPWPVAEVTFVGAEQLAEGSRLTARFAMPETLRDGQQTYRAGGSSGQLRRLLAEHREKSLPIADGKVTLTADADEAELEATLWIGNHGWPLRQITPSRIPLGRASTVVLAPDEMREAEARLTKQFGGK